MAEEGTDVNVPLFAGEAITNATEDVIGTRPVTHHINGDIEVPITPSKQEAEQEANVIREMKTDEAIEDPLPEINESAEKISLPEPTEEEMHQEAEHEAARPTRQIARVVVGTRRPTRYCFHTSVKKGLQEHVHEAYNAITKEFKQLFKHKKALVPIHRDDSTHKQMKKIIRSSMFLNTKYSTLQVNLRKSKQDSLQMGEVMTEHFTGTMPLSPHIR